MPAVDPGAVRPAVVAECRRSDKALPCSGTGPVVLLFRGGSFLIPAPPVSMAAEMEAARSLGFTPRYVNYTAANVLAAWRDTRAVASREAARGRDVYAYGFSAGGVLASLLAQKDRVLAAAAVAPPSNLTTWERNGPIWDYIGNPGPRTKRFLSPPFHPTANPISRIRRSLRPLSIC